MSPRAIRITLVAFAITAGVAMGWQNALGEQPHRGTRTDPRKELELILSHTASERPPRTFPSPAPKRVARGGRR